MVSSGSNETPQLEGMQMLDTIKTVFKYRSEAFSDPFHPRQRFFRYISQSGKSKEGVKEKWKRGESLVGPGNNDQDIA